MKPYPIFEDTPPLLSDVLVAYQRSTTPTGSVLANGHLFEDPIAVINLIQAGIPYRVFEQIQHALPFSDQDWAGFLELSTKSLQRYKAEAGFYFKGFHAQRILEVAELMQSAFAYFGDMAKLKHWLNTPAFVFDGLKPMQLLQDSYGKTLLLATIHRMRHGIYI